MINTVPRIAMPWNWLKAIAYFLVFYILAIHWWFTAPMLSMGQERAALIETQHAMQQELQTESQLLEQLAQLGAANASVHAWSDLDAGNVTAQLGQRLDVWLNTGDVRCQSISRTPGQDQASGRFRKSVLQIRLRCGMQGLSALIQRIEAESTAIRVENLEIVARRNMAAVDQQNTGLDVTLDIAVYRHQPPGAK